MMHTSVRLPEDLDKQARTICQQRGISFAAFFQTAVRNEIRNHEVAEMEKRMSAAISTIGKRIDKAAEANRAGFSLFLALTEELLSHIYPDQATTEAQIKRVFQSAQRNHAGTVKDFLGEINAK